MSELLLQEVRDCLARAQRVAVLTGAGISADSGIPTFRGEEGLWRHYRAEELATPEAFARDPRLVWEWYDWRRALVASKQPNPAHHALARLEGGVPQLTLITQNVDGLHAAAGSRNLIEIHGNIWKVRCTVCGAVEENRRVPIPILPSCRLCGGLLRPHIVWFGEMLDRGDLERSLEACRSCDVMLVIGTAGVVQPAASFAGVARESGAYVVEINRDPTPYTGLVDVSLPGRAAEVVPRLVTSVRPAV
jgi:NAD-dependent deacetylase